MDAKCKQTNVVGPVKLENLRKMYENEVMTIFFFLFTFENEKMTSISFESESTILEILWEKEHQFHFLPPAPETLATPLSKTH